MVCNNYRRNSKLNICTSHGFSYDKLEDNILAYIRNLFLNIDNKKIELNIKNSQTKYDYEKMLRNIEAEINSINSNIDKMYIDKLNNEISEDMYKRLLKKLQADIEEKNEQYTEIEKLKNNSAENEVEDIKKVVKEFLNLEKPTTELMRALINRIELHQNKQVDIVFNFRRLNSLFENSCDYQAK